MVSVIGLCRLCVTSFTSLILDMLCLVINVTDDSDVVALNQCEIQMYRSLT